MDHCSFTSSFSSRSTSHIPYLFLYLTDILLQSLVLLLRRLVLLLQLASIDLASATQHPLQIIHCISWLLGLLVELHQDLGKLVHCSRLLQVLLELLFLGLYTTLHRTISTCDILILSFINEGGGGSFAVCSGRRGCG